MVQEFHSIINILSVFSLTPCVTSLYTFEEETSVTTPWVPRRLLLPLEPQVRLLCRHACILGYKWLRTFLSAAQQPPPETTVTLPPPPSQPQPSQSQLSQPQLSQPQPPQSQPQAAATGKVMCNVVWMTSDLSVKVLPYSQDRSKIIHYQLLGWALNQILIWESCKINTRSY